MSRISPLKYGTDGTENRPGDMDKGLWRRQSGINGRQKITAVFCNYLLYRYLRRRHALPDLKKHGEKIGDTL